MCNYFNALFYLLQISAAFCYLVPALIQERCLSKSLIYECDVYLMHYGNFNAEPTIIRRVLKVFCKIIVAAILTINQKMLTKAAQKIKFSIKDFFSKCEQIHSFLWIWSHLLKKSFMENFIFYAV